MVGDIDKGLYTHAELATALAWFAGLTTGMSSISGQVAAAAVSDRLRRCVVRMEESAPDALEPELLAEIVVTVPLALAYLASDCRHAAMLSWLAAACSRIVMSASVLSFYHALGLGLAQGQGKDAADVTE